MSIKIKISKGTKKASNFIKVDSYEDRLIAKIDRERKTKRKNMKYSDPRST